MGDPGGSSGYDELDPVQAEQNIDAFISHANDLDGPTVQAIASEVAAFVPSCCLDDDERTDRNLGRLASGIFVVCVKPRCIASSTGTGGPIVQRWTVPRLTQNG